MLLSIIIVNYYTEKEILKCLNSIFMQDFPSLEVIIVDNSSSIINNYDYNFTIKVIDTNKNLGFGQANNLGVCHSNGDFILFMNPDCELTQSHDLARMIKQMQVDLSIGILSPAINEGGGVILPSYNYPKHKYLPEHYFGNLSGKVAWVLGAVMLVRKYEFLKLGGFDKDFFLYAEETDLCLRYRQNGFIINYLSSVSVKHIGGASEITASSYDYWKRKQRGLYLFIVKHYPHNVIKRILVSEMIASFIKLTVTRFRIIFGDSSIKMKDNYNRYKAIYDSASRTRYDKSWLYFK